MQSVVLAACAVSPRETPAPVTTAPTSTTAPAATPSYQPGIGIVESASVVALASSPSAGGTGAPASPTMAYRLKMADGSTQNVVHTGERFELGDRVQITGDGRLTRP
jgi:hypothetical protein